MADYNSKYTGEQVEALLDIVSQGGSSGGGGGTITEAEIAAMGFTKNQGTITEVKMNGVSKGTSGVVDLGDVTSKDVFDNLVDTVDSINEDVSQLINDKQDTITDLATIRDGASKGATAVQPSSLASVATSGSYNDLVDKPTFKTVNGESVVGSGNITIEGGTGEVGPQGPQGEQGPKGEDGIGIASVEQTTTSSVDGGSNVVTVTLTNGTTSTFTIKNGSKGSQGEQGIQGVQGIQGPKGETGATGAQGPKGDKGDTGTNGTNGKDGADGDDGATFTPSVDSAGNLSWTNNKGLANPPTVNIKGPKGDKGDAGEGGESSGGGGVETISLSGGWGEPLIIEEMLAEKRYYLYVDSSTGHETIEIQGFEGHEEQGGATIKHFYAVIMSSSLFGDRFELSLMLPDVDIRWANGELPSIVGGDERLYELSISQVNESGLAYYNAVLTPFAKVN